MPDAHERRPGWVFGSAVALLLPLLYLGALGPLAWISSRWGGREAVSLMYRPVTWVAEVSESDVLMDAIDGYSKFGAAESSGWIFIPEKPGHARWTVGIVPSYPVPLPRYSE